MMKSKAAFWNRSTALWASRTSSNMASHSEVSRLLVTIVEARPVLRDERRDCSGVHSARWLPGWPGHPLLGPAELHRGRQLLRAGRSVAGDQGWFADGVHGFVSRSHGVHRELAMPAGAVVPSRSCRLLWLRNLLPLSAGCRHR